MDQGAGPSSGAAPGSPAANGLPDGKPAAKAAPEKTPKQGQQAEEGAAGEGRVQGTGKRGNLTETESRATGWSAFCKHVTGSLHVLDMCGHRPSVNNFSLCMCLPEKPGRLVFRCFERVEDRDWGLLLPAGKVSLKMLMVYVNAMGGKLRFTILMSWFLLVELCRVGATVWLSYWTGIADSSGAHTCPQNCLCSFAWTGAADLPGLALPIALLRMCCCLCLCRSCVTCGMAHFDKDHVFTL